MRAQPGVEGGIPLCRVAGIDDPGQLFDERVARAGWARAQQLVLGLGHQGDEPFEKPSSGGGQGDDVTSAGSGLRSTYPLSARELTASATLHPLAVRVDGRIAAAALAYDRDTDCGIYNVGTHESFRRRGLGTAVTVAQLYHARERGCVTASLQSTPMAEGVYMAAGFRDLGRFLEYVPSGRG